MNSAHSSINRAFGGFITTYNRPETLLKTIALIFQQTMTPSKLIIVDNSESEDTRLAVSGLDDSRVAYLRVGSNCGPAGAAKLGLQILSDEGFEWIYWGDDDDPPYFDDVFEKLLFLARSSVGIGIVGAVGQRFERRSGKVMRLRDEELQRSSVCTVDVVAGNMSMIVSGEVVKRGVLPDEHLFFGFEELDFCIRVKDAGYSIVADSELFYRHRVKSMRVGFKRPIYEKKTAGGLVREYYSLRNLLRICDKNGYVTMKWVLTIKWLGKALYGFTYGFKYGSANARYIISAFRDYLNGQFGLRLKLKREG